MHSAEVKQEFSYPAMRILRKYEPAFRARLLHYLRLRAGDTQNITWEEINGAVSKVFAELTHTRTHNFDSAVERQAMEEYDCGRYKTTQDWINELSSRLAGRD
jgi:hypothetical protein